MTTYYKAVRQDGTDFYTGSVQWAPPAGHKHAGEWMVLHPTSVEIGNHASTYLSVSTVPTDCTGMEWPCRLLEVEAVGEVTAPDKDLPNKRAGTAFCVLREVPATLALGPQGEHVAALLSSLPALTIDAKERASLAWVAGWDDERDAARVDAWTVTGDSSREAARDNAMWDSAMWDATWAAARDATVALLARDLITTEQYATLTRPWRTAIGPIHPDDPELGKP